MHLRVVPRPVPPAPPAGAPKQCTSRTIPSTSLPETDTVPVSVPVPKAGTWSHHPNSTTAQGFSFTRGTRGPVKASIIPSSSARTQTQTQTQAAPASSYQSASSMSWEGTSWGGSGKKEGWFPREWMEEFSRETMGPWERFWGMFTSGKSRPRELASSVVELRNPREVDKGASKMETQEQQEGRKMKTKVLMMEDTSTNKRRNNTPENTSRRTEMEGRGYDQLDVHIDSRPPPPQYQP